MKVQYIVLPMENYPYVLLPNTYATLLICDAAPYVLLVDLTLALEGM